LINFAAFYHDQSCDKRDMFSKPLNIDLGQAIDDKPAAVVPKRPLNVFGNSNGFIESFYCSS